MNSEQSVGEAIGGMRADLIDLSYRMPEGDDELARLWNEIYDALVAFQKRLEGWHESWTTG